MNLDERELFSDERYKKLELRINKPNIFTALANTSYEIRHSNFLAWLLDCDATHGAGRLFADYLIPRLLPDVEFADGNFKVWRERHNIDLLLLSDREAIIIENKTMSTDSIGQLQRYRRVVKEKYPGLSHKFCYLTTQADLPTDVNERQYWHCASYGDLICGMRELVVAKCIDPKVAIYLDDYVVSVEMRLLHSSEYNRLARELVARYKHYLTEVFRSNRVLSAIDASDRRVLEFLRDNSSFTRGHGFFREGGIFFPLFVMALETQGFSVASFSNSTYLCFIGQQDFGPSRAHLPIVFQLRFYEKQSAFVFAAVIQPETSENRIERSLLLKANTEFALTFGSYYPHSRGQNHVAIFRKKIAFNPLEYEVDDLHRAITQLLAFDIKPDAEMVNSAVQRVLGRRG